MTTVDRNLFAHFHRRFVERADDELLATGDGTSFTYADIDRMSARIAAALRDAGVETGDRVSVQVEKSPESLCLYLACLRAGFVFHPINPAYKAKELETLLHHAEPAAVVCDPRKEPDVAALAASAGARVALTLSADGGGSLIERAERASDGFGTVPRSTHDPAALLYTSGTTGSPKGILLSHGNLQSNAAALTSAWGFTAQDRLLHALPIHHVHGLFISLGCVLSSGASMTWLPRFTVDDVLCHLPRCTVMMGVPTYYTRLLAAPELSAELVGGVRLFVSGSAPLLPETFAEFERRTGQRVLERYGMTETNVIASNPLDGERRPGTVGLPLPGVDVRIVDDRGTVLAAGEVGHIQVRGPNVFTGYWRRDAGDDFTNDGFFRTGDLGVFDDDGYLAIVGRSKDLVITGGLNVYPREVEAVIDALPGVVESAVIGVPHPDFGEGVVAVVVPEQGALPSEQAVIDACKAQLADFKVPKRIVLADELPRNVMGKVQKNVLREAHARLFVQAR
ncbi:MAG TPA: AMP-binding protein [Gammaproteobacteria bacterium]